MRVPRLFAALLPAAALACCVSAHAQKPVDVEDVTTPAGLTETGVLNGAPFRIDIPEDWNHNLVMYFHGYAQQPVVFHPAERLTGQQAPLLDRRYAVAQSAYSQTGWALQQAFPETEALRRYFVKKFGSPAATYAAGGSMGGALVMITLELNPRPYLGGLDLCGSVGPTFESFERRFAMRAAFDHYFPSVLPPLLAIPASYEASQAERDLIEAALRANPLGAAQMRALLGVHTDNAVAWDMAYFTFVIGDMERRAQGNPFDNRNFLYTGASASSSAADFDLNDGVHRYAADPHALAYLMRHYTPTGRLGRPMLALHTLYDPTVPPSSLALYDHMVQAAGFGDNLVQQYVHREGHCNITQEEEGRAFDELVAWTHGSPRPTPGLLHEAPLMTAESRKPDPHARAHP